MRTDKLLFFMKYYSPSLKINLFIRFILAFVGVSMIVIPLAAIFGEAKVSLNGVEVGQNGLDLFKIAIIIILTFMGISCLCILENIKYSLLTLGIASFAFLSLAFFPFFSRLTLKMTGFLIVNVVPFYLFPLWLFNLEFKRRQNIREQE